MPTQRDSLIDCCYQLTGKLNSSFWPPSNVISIEQHEKWLEPRHQFWVESSTSYPFDTSVNPQLIKSVKKTGKRSQFWSSKQNQLSRRLCWGFLTQFTQLVLQQQHTGLTAMPGRAPVRENGWDPPRKPSILKEWTGGSWGKRRICDLLRSPHPVW